MASRDHCPNCNQRLTAVLAAYCSACGSVIPRESRMVLGSRVRLVADRQRFLIWVVLANLIIQFGLMFMGDVTDPFVLGSLMLVLLAVLVSTVVAVLRLAAALGTHIVVLILLAPLCFIPLLNLLVLLAENGSATRLLRSAGIRVGFMGARKADVVSVTSIGCCRKCGYDLQGLASGNCPECGLAFAPHVAAIANS